MAAKAALSRADQESSSGSGNATARRLLEQKDQVVQDLVAAVAKHSLREAMSSEMCAGLVRLVTAVSAAGSSMNNDGARAARYRSDLAKAMADCASAVPCWIMPTYRIAQSLPAEIGSFDLVVLDEASQSDITALGALLRGKRVLVVGDSKQVSPTAVGVSETKIKDLQTMMNQRYKYVTWRSLVEQARGATPPTTHRHPHQPQLTPTPPHFTRPFRYVEMILPGKSIFDQAKACYADATVTLTQHFRCVPKCIEFSNKQFYHDGLQPRRLPPQSERLTPALVDVFVKGGRKKGKTNVAEAEAIALYLRQELDDTSSPDSLSNRSATVGILSLMGIEQTRVIRTKILEKLTDEQLAKHQIVVGDAASFQGDERDVIILSMVASKGEAPSQNGQMYRQRYNVALSRARDRMVLFRSLNPADMSNSEDLKVKTIQFFRAAHTASASGGGGAESSRGRKRASESTVEGQLLAWLDQEGYSYDNSCSIAGSVAVVEDVYEDRRLCVTLDGSNSSALTDWMSESKEQRVLERTGWGFYRIWAASWLVDRAACEEKLRRACKKAGVRPRGGADNGGAAAGADAGDNSRASCMYIEMDASSMVMTTTTAHDDPMDVDEQAGGKGKGKAAAKANGKGKTAAAKRAASVDLAELEATLADKNYAPPARKKVCESAFQKYFSSCSLCGLVRRRNI